MISVRLGSDLPRLFRLGPAASIPIRATPSPSRRLINNALASTTAAATATTTTTTTTRSTTRTCSSRHTPPPRTAPKPKPKPVLSAMAGNDEISHYLQETHDRVFEHNACWAANKRAKDPDFFAHLSAGQQPDYLWIGCSDSRIPAEQITGMEPGEAFVHRNIANLVCSIDLNAMSVINYAVDHLEVKHIVVCGHYGCGGVKAAMTPKDMGLLNPWLRNIRDVYRLHEKELDTIEGDARYDRLVELNVIEQCRNVIKTAAVQKSYAAKKFPIVHGWCFGFGDGLLKDLKFDHVGTLADVQKIYNLTS